MTNTKFALYGHHTLWGLSPQKVVGLAPTPIPLKVLVPLNLHRNPSFALLTCAVGRPSQAFCRHLMLQEPTHFRSLGVCTGLNIE